MKRALQIFRDGKKHERSLTVPLLPGEQGNIQTLEAMKQIVLEDRLQPDLRSFVLREIVKGVRGHDSMGEVEAIHRFARDKITYRQDPYDVERVPDIWSTLYALNPNEPEGDCGVKSNFIASCCAILGHQPFFVVIKQSADQEAFNHVFNAVVVDGNPMYLDATPEDAPPGWKAPSMVELWCPIFD